MTRKQMRMMMVLIPLLAIGAFAVNADALMNLIGASSPGSNQNAPPPKVAPQQQPEKIEAATKHPEESPVEAPSKGVTAEVAIKTVAEAHLTPLGAYTGDYRNPFAPPERSGDMGETQTENWVLPPDVTAQVIYIGKTKKIACIEGRRLQEGDRFQGGKVISIEPTRVTVEMPNHVRWAIPLAPSLKLGGKNP